MSCVCARVCAQVLHLRAHAYAPPIYHAQLFIPPAADAKGDLALDFAMFKELCGDLPHITQENVLLKLISDAGVGWQ